MVAPKIGYSAVLVRNETNALQAVQCSPEDLLRDQIIEAVRSANLQREPFCHIYMEDIMT
jgi:hypothetical protein